MSTVYSKSKCDERSADPPARSTNHVGLPLAASNDDDEQVGRGMSRTMTWGAVAVHGDPGRRVAVDLWAAQLLEAGVSERVNKLVGLER